MIEFDTINGLVNALTACATLANTMFVIAMKRDIRLIPRFNKQASVSNEYLSRVNYRKQLLAEIRNLSNAGRVVVGKFSNGIAWGEEHHITMSISDENAYWLNPIKREYQGIDISNISEEVALISANEVIFVTRDEEGISQRCQDHLDKDGIVCKLGKGIYNRQGKPIGIIEIHWGEEVDDPRNDSEYWHELNKLLNKLTDNFRESSQPPKRR